MASWNTDNKSLGCGSLRDLNAADTCSTNFSTLQTTNCDDDHHPPRSTTDYDNIPSPSTPLRERRLPASFWQEPNVPRRSVRTSPRCSTRILPPNSLLYHQQTFDSYQRRCFHYPFSTWPGVIRDRNNFCWKDAPAFIFDVSTKPAERSAAAADFFRHFQHLSPWPVTADALPGAYPLLAPDYATQARSLEFQSPSEELASSAAVVAAYLRWRAADEGRKPPIADSTPSPVWPSSSSRVWRPCSTAPVAVHRLHRYQPY